MSNKVKITLNNAGGELDSVEVIDDMELSVTNALIEMINGLPLGAGDTITIECVE